jgi:hypothetical protein
MRFLKDWQRRANESLVQIRAADFSFLIGLDAGFLPDAGRPAAGD